MYVLSESAFVRGYCNHPFPPDMKFMLETVPTVGSCLTCGYDLRGLDSRTCPECGKLFNPDDIATVGPTGLRFGPLGRWATSRPSRWTWAFSAVLVLMILVFARYPHYERPYIPLYPGLWPALFTLWIARLLGQLITRTKVADPRYRRRVRLTSTTLMLAAITLLAVLVRRDVIFDLSMKISEPALIRLGQEIRNKPEYGKSRHWAGLYLIDSGESWGTMNFTLWTAEVEMTFYQDDGGTRGWTFVRRHQLNDVM